MPQYNHLARSNELNHPQSVTISTPLLVPSFSSKGFGIDGRNRSDIHNYFDVAKEILTDSMLVSAYDVFYKNLPEQKQPITDITFVDSGGYEISDQQDLSEIIYKPVDKKRQKMWTPDLLKTVYDNWSHLIPSVFVNYDNAGFRKPIEQQIECAEDFLFSYKNQLWTILIKPETEDQNLIKVENIIANIKKLRNFHIIGFTEKELGNSILDRMYNISKIRLELDENGISAPIHVFGSLDPVSSPLYFLSGAEIFDGLTWLRYGYSRGVAAYSHNIVALERGIDNKINKVRASNITSNYNYLIELQNEMKMFVNDRDFEVFKYNSSFLYKSFNLLRTRNRRAK